MGKGQVWSLDLVIGMLVFLLAVGTIYSFLNVRTGKDPTPLRIESEVVATALTTGTDDPGLKVADQNQLDMNRLGTLAAEAEVNYTQLKRRLGIDHDFCIYLQDEEGNLIYVKDTSGNTYAGIGSRTGELNLTDDTPCGIKVT